VFSERGADELPFLIVLLAVSPLIYLAANNLQWQHATKLQKQRYTWMAIWKRSAGGDEKTITYKHFRE